MPGARFLQHRILFPLRVWLAVLLCAIPASLVVIALPGQNRRRRLARRAARLLLHLSGIPWRIEGLRHLPAEACIVAANHASYLDGVLLTAALPPRFSFVIKHEITRTPVIGRMLARLGSEFVERFDRKQAHHGATRLIRQARRGACLGVFPEGTFHAEPGLRSFHLGAFLTATRAGLPVVPVAIRGARRILPSACWWPHPGRIHIEVQAPVAPPGKNGDAARRLRDAVRAHILETCGEPDLTRHE